MGMRGDRPLVPVRPGGRPRTWRDVVALPKVAKEWNVCTTAEVDGARVRVLLHPCMLCREGGLMPFPGSCPVAYDE
eukprot:gene43336-46623_t